MSRAASTEASMAREVELTTRAVDNGCIPATSLRSYPLSYRRLLRCASRATSWRLGAGASWASMAARLVRTARPWHTVYSGVGCAATVAAHPCFGLVGPVDLVVEPLAGLAAENRGAERDPEGRDQRDQPAGGQRAAVDGKPRKVQRVEHVVLRAADGGQRGDDDGD